MSPRTRAEVKRAQLLAPGSLVNTSGLPSLPVEILGEIVSCLSTCRGFYFQHVRNLEYTQSLRALSETSQRLRSVLLGCAQSRSLDCGTSSPGWRESRDMLAREFAEELVRQLEVVTVRNPALASEVLIITVFLSKWSADTVFAEFFRWLAITPNLHTVQILRAPDIDTRRFNYRKLNDPQAFGRALRNSRFPGIRTLVLHPAATDMITCCRISPA
ncbi:hypothetical protein C8R47DRAFT_1134854 [Mycena vitilis]|nr:hypothetical protein C8R47DRAFT_1134854 [Mycena vitilis]